VNGSVEFEQIILLGTALAIGLLIGVERGWKTRDAREGERIAGLRTYGLTGLLGGLAGLLVEFHGQLMSGFVFLGFTAAVTLAYMIRRDEQGDVSITSLITLLLTFVLGVLATLDHVSLAASAAVVVALLLRFKNVLHGWLRSLERKELHAALRLLLISVVLLPVLPNQGYGPWQVLNPYEIWWMVVLIAGISFVGYFSMKIAGAGKGVIMTALAAGMVSSTALTLHFSRLSRKQMNMEDLLAAGILIACGTMFPRVVLIAGLVNPALFLALLVPMSIMTLLTLLAAFIVWRRSPDNAADAVREMSRLSNPLELKPALFFGALLVVVILLGKFMADVFGETGIYWLAAVSGIADVDAINLTLSRMSSGGLPQNVVVLGILLASSSNTILKGILAVFIGGSGLLLRVLAPLFIAAAAGLASIALMQTV